MTKEIREKGVAANRLRRLRRMAAELRAAGWKVEEPK
jgi:hypothetical protein